MTALHGRPLVSVVIPTRNRLARVTNAIDSVLAQDGVGQEFDVEIIVVDDASTDATQATMERHPRIRYLRLDQNRGASVARNNGIRAARGAYVALLDDDDTWLPHRLAAHVPVLEAQPHIGVVYGQIIVKDAGREQLWPDARRAPTGFAFPSLVQQEYVLPSHALIRRDSFGVVGLFDEALGTMEHFEMFLRLSFHVPFAFVPGAVAIGHFSEDGKWFTNIKAGNYRRNVYRIVDRALGWMVDDQERTELRRDAYVSWLWHIAYRLARAGMIEQLVAHLLEALSRDPWIPEHRNGRKVLLKSLRAAARALARESPAPIAAVQQFCDQLDAALAAARDADRFVREVRSTVWTEAASTLLERGFRVQAAQALARAGLSEPRRLGQTPFWRLLFKMALPRAARDVARAARRSTEQAPDPTA